MKKLYLATLILTMASTTAQAGQFRTFATRIGNMFRTSSSAVNPEMLPTESTQTRSFSTSPPVQDKFRVPARSFLMSRSSPLSINQENFPASTEEQRRFASDSPLSWEGTPYEVSARIKGFGRRLTSPLTYTWAPRTINFLLDKASEKVLSDPIMHKDSTFKINIFEHDYKNIYDMINTKQGLLDLKEITMGAFDLFKILSSVEQVIQMSKYVDLETAKKTELAIDYYTLSNWIPIFEKIQKIILFIETELAKYSSETSHGQSANTSPLYQTFNELRNEKDLWKILNIPRNSNRDTIKKARIEFMKKYHPDLFQNKEDKYFASAISALGNKAVDELLESR
jgi:hypothetical protein